MQYRAKNNILIGITLLCMVTIVAFGYLMEEEPISGQSLIAQTYTMDERKINELPKTDVEEIRIEQIYPCVDQNIVQEEVLENTQGVAEPSVEQNTTSAFLTKSIKISHQGDAEAPTTQKPKLVIIIDDVTTPKELHAIEALGIKITPSIFPPSERSMKSHLLAKGLNHFMIHLPMESGSKQFNTQYKTLFTTDSEAKIQERVKEIRQLFPTGHYINNHTGSVFTANFDAMMGLYKALREEGFIFVDSLTIGTSKVKKVMNVFGDDYIARDVFIDNEHTISYIHHQLQIAVEDAKRKGYAIAIGHPHCTTLEALAQATDILAEVELVYIDALYK